MPKARKTSPATKINKSAWIRSQSASMPAKDVLAKAKAEGIKLSLAQIYTARSTAKKNGEVHREGARPSAHSVRAQGSADLTLIKRAVFEHGFARVEAYLAELRRSVGL